MYTGRSVHSLGPRAEVLLTLENLAMLTVQDASPVGRVAIVTGASSGLGRATARRLSRAGMPLVITARREGKLAEVAQEIRTLEEDAFLGGRRCGTGNRRTLS